MIPDEAVEAGAKVFARLTESEWPYEASLGQARLLLEAAAPHLRAAWEAEAALEAKAEEAHREWVNGE